MPLTSWKKPAGYLLAVALGILPVIVLLRPPAPVRGLQLYLSGRSSLSLTQTIDATRRAFDTRARVLDYWKRCRILRTEGSLRLLSTPNGNTWLPASCGPLCLMAEQQPDEYGSVHPGDVVLDCGSNIGAFARRALAAGAARVIAIEPAPENLACLRRNLAGGIADGRVTVVDQGVWDRETTLEFTTDSGNSAENSAVLRPTTPAATIRIPVTTIDRLVRTLSLDKVDLIKMDIEGSEKQALSGARDTIAALHPRLGIATEHLPDDETAIPALIRSIHPAYAVTPAGPATIIPATGRAGHPILLFTTSYNRQPDPRTPSAAPPQSARP